MSTLADQDAAKQTQLNLLVGQDVVLIVLGYDKPVFGEVAIANPTHVDITPPGELDVSIYYHYIISIRVA